MQRLQGHEVRSDVLPQLVPTDGALLAAVGTGETDALGTLFLRYSDRIRRYAVARIGADAADDIVVEVFVVAWRRAAGFQSAADQSALSWLFAIAVNMLRTHSRDERKWLASFEQSSDVAAQIEDVASGDYDPPSPTLVAVLRDMPRSERDILLLTSVGELSVTEASSALRIASSAGRVRLHRARRRAHEALSRSHGDA